MGANGSPTTANFLAGMIKSVPPLEELFKTAGMKLPSYLGEPLNLEAKGEDTE
jgi:flotillin